MLRVSLRIKAGVLGFLNVGILVPKPISEYNADNGEGPLPYFLSIGESTELEGAKPRMTLINDFAGLHATGNPRRSVG